MCGQDAPALLPAQSEGRRATLPGLSSCGTAPAGLAPANRNVTRAGFPLSQLARTVPLCALAVEAGPRREGLVELGASSRHAPPPQLSREASTPATPTNQVLTGCLRSRDAYNCFGTDVSHSRMSRGTCEIWKRANDTAVGPEDIR